MKVLHVFKTYLPDSFTGVERVIWEIAEGTGKFGVDSKVLSLSSRPVPEMIPVGHHESHRAKLNLYVASTGISLPVFGMFRRLSLEADIIHYHFPWPMMDVLHFAAPPRRPTIVTYHSDIVRQKSLSRFYAPLMHRFLDSVDSIVATSPNYRDGSPVLRRHARNTSTIPIGLTDRVPPSAANINHWRQVAGEGFFLFVGALRYYKGLQFLIDAARLTGLPVIVAGTGEAGEWIERENLPNVRLVGGVSDEDKESLLALSAGFVFPSHLRSEAFGVALLEAARAGRPMISSEIGTGTSYVNEDGRTGLVVPPEDPAALADAMLTIARGGQDVERMGLSARERYLALFTAEQMAASYFAQYQQLLLRQG